MSFNIAIFGPGGNAINLYMSMIQNKKAGVRQVVIDANQHNRRIDNFMFRELGKVPKSRVYQMLRRGEIRVNGGRVKPEYRLQTGDTVRIPPVYIDIHVKTEQPGSRLLQLVGDSQIFENADLLVLNKPAGLSVHGGSGQPFGIIEIMRQIRPADMDLQLVHRLDRETSGCLMIAKNTLYLRWLHDCLREGRIQKQYLALLSGKLQTKSVEVSVPIQKNIAKSGERMATVSDLGKHALTIFTRLQIFNQATLARVEINTGRTHQIRVHAAHIQHPVAGDSKYGDKHFNQVMRQLGLKRLFLHAQALVIPARHGKHDGLMLEAALPPDLRSLLDIFNNYN